MGTGAVSEIRIRAHDLTADSAPPKELAAPKLSDVVGAIGHDLRTPLAVVSMAQDYLSAHLPAATPELEEMLELIRRGVDNCLLKVEALIDFARDEPLARDCVTPDALIEEAASAVGAAFALRIETAIEANLPPLLVDRYLFRRALIHLMRNAAEAAPTGASGWVRVSAAREEGFIVVAVSDNGAGMGPEQQSRIFDPHYSTKSQGTGLGLAIVRNIVEQHGAELRVRSAPGGGSEFAICLPLA